MGSPRNSPLALALIVLVVLVPCLAAAQTPPALFGTREVRNSNIAPFTKWTTMLARQRGEPQHYNDTCHPRRGHCYVQEWRALIGQLRGQAPMRQLQAVNAFMNRMPYVEDIDNYGVADYWATPLEFLARDGDCEDYAIAKYFTLRELGFSPSDMRILVLNDLNRRLAHAILIVYLDGRAYALDNQIAQVVSTEVIHHYQPIYSINEQAWWLHQGAALPPVASRAPQSAVTADVQSQPSREPSRVAQAVASPAAQSWGRRASGEREDAQSSR